MKTSGFLLMAFLCSLISPVRAYDLSRKFGLGVGAGYPIPVWGNPFNDVADPKYQLSAFGRYFFDQSVGMELGASLSKFKKTEWKFKNADVMGLWRMTGTTSISPLIGLGAALTDIDNYNPASAKLSFLGRLGAEMDIGHSLSLGLFADYQYVSKIMGELPTRPAHVIIPQLALIWTFGAESSNGVHEEIKSKDNEKAKEAKAEHSVLKEKEKERVSDVVETRSSSTSKKPDLTVYFDTEKSDISAVFSKKLKRIAEKMKKNARIATIIEGHADSTGPRGYNQKLSKRRAEAVKKQLMEFGVSEANLETEGFGEDKPIATNKTKEGRAKNRRSALFISVKERINVM